MITVPINGNPQVFEMLDEEAGIILAEFYDFENTGYGTLTLEQWGSDPNVKQFVVSGVYRNILDEHNIDENFEVNMTNEDSFKDAYEKASRLYNSFCPNNRRIPVIWDELEF